MGCSPQVATADGRFARETIGDTLKKSEILRPNWTAAAARGSRVPGSKRFDRLNPAQEAHEPGTRSYHAGSAVRLRRDRLAPRGPISSLSLLHACRPRRRAPGVTSSLQTRRRLWRARPMAYAGGGA